MAENQRQKHQKFKSKRISISVDKNEVANTAGENVNAEKALGFVDLKDFPELKTSGGNHDNITHSQNNNEKVLNKKSWLSVVNKGNSENFKQAFPTLPNLESIRKNRNHLKKDNENSKSFVGNDEIVIEKPVAPKDKKVQNQVISKENKSVSSFKIVTQPQRNPHKKKRSDPILFNFQDVLGVQKHLKRSKQHSIFKSRRQQLKNKEVLFGNILDSSNPIRSRGKHREIKKKKLTKLKLAIIKERIIKQKMKEKGINAYSSGTECFNFIENTDFKVEIKKYLDELNEKKRKKMENEKNGNKPSKESLNPKKGNEQTQEINTNDAVNEKENLENLAFEIKDEKIPKNASESSYRGEIKFTSKFREYCDNILTPELNAAVSELIENLVNLQDRQFAWDPIKAKKKKRHVSGLREVKKYLTLKKVKLIIIAPNLEKLQMEGGVYDSINELKSMASDQNVPYGFALNRYKLGRCAKKKVPVSAFAVLNYEGIEALFENTVHHLNAAKESFLELTRLNATKKVDEGVEKEDVNARVISSLISAFREELKLPNENSQPKLEE